MVLLHRRDNLTTHQANKWDHFGGAIEAVDQDVPKEAVIREINEELGVQIDQSGLNLISKEENFYYIIFPKHIRELRLGEGAGISWFSFEEIENLEGLGLVAENAMKYINKLKIELSKSGTSI